jgi:capsular polysaccharide transport system permease protein
MCTLALVLELDKQLKLREHFGKIRADLPLRLPGDASVEDFVAYFRARVELGFDDRSALLTIRAQGLDPEYAQRLNVAILDASERFVNETSHRIARERLRFAEGELQTASKRVESTSGTLLEFQGRTRLLDPAMQAQAAGVLTVELEAQRARAEAELNGLRGFLNDEAFQVQALKSRIAAINSQIDAEKRRATVDNAKGMRLNKLALEFEALKLQAEFARDGYKLALGAVENARIEASQKIKSLVIVEPPSLPETAEYPLVTYNMSTLLAVCVLLYAIVRLVLATIREHQD